MVDERTNSLEPSSTEDNDESTDFIALGMGGTNLLAMLWSVAMGRRVVGVEMRGEPLLGVHWNIREDLYHQLGLVDEMMLARYGEDRLPRKQDGSIVKLADSFYSPRTRAGYVVPDEIMDGYERAVHIGGRLLWIEYIDDRWKQGKPNRTVVTSEPPCVPDKPDASKIGTSMRDVLDGPSMFQSAAFAFQKMLLRYLDQMESLDVRDGCTPRVRLYQRHRVVETEGEGFVRQKDGRVRIVIEEISEYDLKGQTFRSRTPGTQPIDLGVPELFSVAQGFHSTDAQRLGFTQHDVHVDHGDGRGAIVAQADYVAAQIEVLVDGRLRRRIASEFDEEGNEYWVRQLAVGHENDPQVGWVVVQVPDYMDFCPLAAGLVPEGTCKDSPAYFAAYRTLLYDFYIAQASLVLEMDVNELRTAQLLYGPKMFSVVERVGEEARIATNGVMAGDSFGNGHFLTSGGAMTGMIGHAMRFLHYWQGRDRGRDGRQCRETSIRQLADGIKSDTMDWLRVSAREFSEAVPISFGAERGAQITAASGIDTHRRARIVEAGRRARHDMFPLDPGDWRRLFVRNGRVITKDLPLPDPTHPLLRGQHGDGKMTNDSGVHSPQAEST